MRASVASSLRIAVCVAVAAAGAGCGMARDFLPRTHTSSVSPDGRYTALVRQRLNPDPPDDHLYLGVTGVPPRHLMALAPDSDWCRTIIWTRDSRRVGFVIRDQRLAVFDTETGELTAMVVLVEADGYPGSQEARHITFNDDGSAVSFERFDRPMTRLKRGPAGSTEVPIASISPPLTVSRPERNRGREVVPVPAAPGIARGTAN